MKAAKKMVFDGEEFKKALKQKRFVELDIDLQQAAKQIGTSKATLSRLESGRTPDVNTLFRCCAWLGLEMNSFFK